MDYPKKSKSMMASIASAVDAIAQPFCCRPSYIIQASPVSDKPDKSCCELIRDKYTVYSPLNTKKSTVSSRPRQEVVIQMPSLESESQSCSSVLKPHTTVKQHQDTITINEDIVIVGPPSITRFPNPFILLADDEKETAPETPTAAALEKLLHQSSHTYHVHKHSTETRRIPDDSFSLLEPVPHLLSTNE